MVRSKSSEIFFSRETFLFKTLEINGHNLQHSSLGHQYTEPNVPVMRGTHLEVPILNRVQHCLRFAFNLVGGVESATFQASVDLGEQEEATRAKLSE